MKTTTITNLRTHLSRLLDAVRQGQTIEIFSRNVPIARLVPLTPSMRSERGRIPPWLKKLERAGVVRIGTMKRLPEIGRRKPPGGSGARALDALLEERREGR